MLSQNAESAVGAVDEKFGPWNPGVLSRIPREWLGLATIFRPENVYGDLASAEELAALTGLAPSEVIAFRPQRLALHKLLIRVTAEFVVPDGSRIEDLGINFRRIASRIFAGYLVPEMDAIARAFEDARRRATETIEAAFSGLIGGRGAPSWGPAQILECERRAEAGAVQAGAVPAGAVPAGAGDARLALRALARILSSLLITHGRAWGSRDLIVRLAHDRTANVTGSAAVGRTIEPLLLEAARAEGYGLLPRQERPVVINTKGASASGKSTLRPAAEAAGRRASALAGAISRSSARTSGASSCSTMAASAPPTSTPAPSPPRSCRSSTRSSTATWRASHRAARCRTC